MTEDCTDMLVCRPALDLVLCPLEELAVCHLPALDIGPLDSEGLEVSEPPASRLSQKRNKTKVSDSGLDSGIIGGADNLTGSRPACLTGSGPACVTGSEPACVTGSGPACVTGNGPACVTGNGPVCVTGNGPACVTGNEPVCVTGNGPSDEASNRYLNKDGDDKSSGWKRLRRMVRWTPFIQTYRQRKYPWVQLAGHSGSFMRGSQGTVLKKCGEQEELCYRLLMEDPLSRVVPLYHRNVVKEGRKYLELACCLSEFNNPSVMDVKMGVRTFLAGETSVSKPRCDLYEKMVSEDPSAPTELEEGEQAITKYRYLDWRDCISSSRQLGFRIEATTSKGKSSKDFKSIRTEEQVESIFTQFTDNKTTVSQYLERLQLIHSTCLTSPFFSAHELIGSSLLFIHDDTKASIWMIDFEKSTPVLEEQRILHTVQWEEGSREDGYLIGLNSLISLFQTILQK